MAYANSVPLYTLDSDLVVFVGGITEEGATSVLSKAVYSLNMQTFEWKVIETLGSAPQPRWRHTATLLQEKIVVHGGDAHLRGEGAEVLGDLNILDTQTWEWSGTVDVQSGDDRLSSSQRYEMRLRGHVQDCLEYATHSAYLLVCVLGWAI